ncbi:MAG: flagellar basal body L-ring protein FlgH [Gammaproteobacteria bacterium]|nr:flagellar basal body L-ring protein FlgH [Gammaproteobacteria bacterium]
MRDGKPICVRLIVILSISMILSACGLPLKDANFAPTYPEEIPDDAPANGTIFRAGYEVSLFEDVKARRIGDILTILLIERTDASKSATTATKKSRANDLSAPTILGQMITHNGDPVFSTTVDAEQEFAGEGTSAQSNSIDGAITVTVAKRFSNGNLLVRGEKWMTINQGMELIRFSGLVRLADINPDNTVPSTKVADAKIIYGGKGVIAHANTMSWLSRFFNSPFSPL